MAAGLPEDDKRIPAIQAAAAAHARSGLAAVTGEHLRRCALAWELRRSTWSASGDYSHRLRAAAIDGQRIQPRSSGTNLLLDDHSYLRHTHPLARILPIENSERNSKLDPRRAAPENRQRSLSRRRAARLDRSVDSAALSFAVLRPHRYSEPPSQCAHLLVLSPYPRPARSERGGGAGWQQRVYHPRASRAATPSSIQARLRFVLSRCAALGLFFAYRQNGRQQPQSRRCHSAEFAAGAFPQKSADLAARLPAANSA